MMRIKMPTAHAMPCGLRWAQSLTTKEQRGNPYRKPRMPIFAFLSDERLYNQLALNWGVVPLLHSGKGTRLDEVVSEAISICKVKGHLSSGDKVVIVAGLPLAQQGTTNMIRVESVS